MYTLNLLFIKSPKSSTLSKRSRWLYELKSIFILALIGVPFSLITCPDCWWDNTHHLKYAILVSSSFWIVLAKGNSFVNHLLGLYIEWLKEPVKRLIASLFAHSVFTVVAVILLVKVLGALLGIQMGSISFTILLSLGISLVATLIGNSRTFLLSWRALAIESEKIKKEAIVAKYESLKNQVNPHFLFNSLNTLTNLVYEDADLSAKFIKKLSEVYRYVLETREKEVVPMDEELRFVRSYIFLQQIRHEDSLVFKLDEEINKKAGVIPLGIQMLVENAIKHNVISADAPLTIRIFQQEDLLVVENTLKKKNILAEESSGVGLENIRSRYSLLSEVAVEVIEENDLFIVKLPLLKL